MKKHSILSVFAALAIGFSATSCDDYLDVNHNIDAPAYVDAYLYLPGVQQSFYNLYTDARYTCGLTNMTNAAYYADHHYPKASDTGGAIWRMTYWEHGMNLENLINQSLKEENYHMAGIGYILKALSWDYTSKYHGEMPLSDCFIPGQLEFKYDYQELIFMKIREWAKEGIKYLEMEDNSPLRPQIAGNDYIYGGDIEKWKKLGYAVIVRNLASLTQKKDFITKYYPQLIDAAGKAFTSVNDDATIAVEGGGPDAQYDMYNNTWGVYNGYLGSSYSQDQYAVDVFTGMILKVSEQDNEYIKIPGADANENIIYKYEIEENQIICDTLVNEYGHWDPRRVAKLETVDGSHVANFAEIDSIKAFKYHGGRYGNAAYFNSGNDYYGATTARNGNGRWIYRNDAPYILTTYAELLFNVAEAHFVAGKKNEAFETWKKAVAADMEFTAKYLVPGSVNITNEKLASGKYGDVTFHVGDKITKDQFANAAAEYLAGPFVAGVTDFTLSHIMMQKFIALYPWGSNEVWVDMRKYHYDIKYSGEVPSFNDGWDMDNIYHKYESDPTKVYKGFYTPYSQLSTSKIHEENGGSPCYRIRPRYNSEYVWNIPALEQLQPISGTADNYHCSIPWFAYPGDQPGAPSYDEAGK